MQTKQERAKKAGQVLFVYTLNETKTGNVIYVGVTRYLGRRMAEHVRSQETTKAAIYVYMREKGIKLFSGVTLTVVDKVFGREEANKIETELISKHKATAQNGIVYDTRKYNTDPRHHKVRCITNGKEYWAVKPVTEEYNVTRYKLDKAIRNKTPIHSGELFEYIN